MDGLLITFHQDLRLIIMNSRCRSLIFDPNPIIFTFQTEQERVMRIQKDENIYSEENTEEHGSENERVDLTESENISEIKTVLM